MEGYEREHMNTVRALSPECMVLLKSDGSFPLDAPGKIALYGNAARKTIKGGTGSGDVNTRHYVSVEEGLENAGFSITTKGWLDGYDAVWDAANKEFRVRIKRTIAEQGISAIMLGIGAIMTEPAYELPLTGEGDTAVYVLGRISGEGADRAPEKGNLLLTDTEVRDILQLQKQYARFMLVLNVGGVVDLSPVVDEVSNILLISQPGIAVGDAFADVLLGKAYPSGKLASTWAAWQDYCPVAEFGDPNDTRYKEGIYVGYRYFDTVDKAPLFPFGYGLAYTQFAISDAKTAVEENKVRVTVTVTNTGARVGKEVAQLYVSVPCGALPQPNEHVAADTCPCFLVAARDDRTVDIKNSLMMQLALAEHGVAFESHTYSYGGHGFSTAEEWINTNRVSRRVPNWVPDSIGWLEELFGTLTSKGFVEPDIKISMNANNAPVLSVECTLGHIRKQPDAVQAILHPLFAGIKAVAEARGFAEEGLMAAVSGNTVRELMEMVQVPDEAILKIDKALHEIANQL